MAKRSKRKRRGRLENIVDPNPRQLGQRAPTLTVDKWGSIFSAPMTPPPANAYDLLKRDQPNPPVVVR